MIPAAGRTLAASVGPTAGAALLALLPTSCGSGGSNSGGSGRDTRGQGPGFGL